MKAYNITKLLIVFSISLLFSAITTAKTYHVNSTEDTDDAQCDALSATTNCTLREAINLANEHPGHDKILFNIPVTDEGCRIAPGDIDRICTIRVNSSGLGYLPVISDRLTLDGSINETRNGIPGSVKNPNKFATKRPGIELAGYLADVPGAPGAGLSLQNVSHSVVKGLIINRFNCFKPEFSPAQCAGITMVGGQSNNINGNYIGTDVTGTRDICDPEADIGCSNVIGKITFGNNLGVFVGFESLNTKIGGKEKNKRNIVSNNYDGIIAIGSRLKIAGNFVGSNVYGTGLNFGNVEEGIDVQAQVNLSEDLLDRQDNKIDGNIVLNSQTRSGIRIWGNNPAFIERTVVINNKVGVNLNGDPGPNRSGIALLQQVKDARIGFDIKRGKIKPQPNHIAYNIGSGIILNERLFEMATSTPTGNVILFNSIHDNVGPTDEGLGVGFAMIPPFKFNGQGVTPNDPMDVDQGSNNLQNFPLLSKAVKWRSILKVTGALNSEPHTTYVLAFYANESAETLPDTIVAINPEVTRDLFSEGKTPLGFWLVKTDGNGDANFKAYMNAKQLPICQIDQTEEGLGCITATATKAALNTERKRHKHHYPHIDLVETSEFSPAILIEE